MKRIFLIILISLFSVSLFSEIIKIDTSKGKKTLIIPDTYNKLKIAYIDMAKLYVEERYDHEKTLAQLNDMFKVTDILYKSIDKLSSVNTQLSKIANSLTNKKLFQFFITGGIKYNVLTPMVYPEIGVSIYFYELFNISLLYQVPTNIEILFGWRLFQ